MSGLNQFKAIFVQECNELLGKLEHAIGSLSGSHEDAAHLNEAFRAIHSIKGGAGMFGFTQLVSFAHAFEGLLELIRSGQAEIGPAAIVKALVASDVLADLVRAAEIGETVSEHYLADTLERLSASLNLARPPIALPQGASAAKEGAANGAVPKPSKYRYKIAFEPGPDLLRRAIEPLGLFRSLMPLGRLSVAADLSRLPAWRELDPAQCHMSWRLELESSAALADIREVFAFADGSSTLAIEVTSLETECETRPSEGAAKPDPGVAVAASTPMTGPERALAMAAEAAQLKLMRDRRVASIRVDLDRVDKLVNLVGEIVISQSMVLQQVDPAVFDSNSQLYRNLSQLLQHTRNLQDSVMAIRAQPVRTIFSRMPRAVRDLMQLTGKNVVLEMTGEDTEIDKTIIEELSDPLIHLIRNSIDHGIESEAERLAAGKRSHGTIRLDAAQRGSRIVIQVSDDGRGIDRERVRRRAIERGLISEDARLSSDEIDNLVFLPGFSTTENVSSISGRGVGMDVVLNNIQKIGGRVTLRSEPGRGTVTMLTLPLTLAVMEGMIVISGGARYLVPLNAIVECLIMPRTALRTVPGFGEVVNVRGRQVRIIDLAATFGTETPASASQIQIVLVELENGTYTGMIVDEIVGQQQVVVKSVRDNFADVRGVAGATILGDGSVALILDVSSIADLPSSRMGGNFEPGMPIGKSGVKAA